MLCPLRLKIIASFIKPNEKVADIGADHGLLELYLIARNTNNKIVAIENKLGPYKTLFERLISIENIRLSYSNGMQAVDKEVQTVVLAGMGGMNILHILKKYPKKLDKLEKIIIEPHRDANKIREFLASKCFKITHEKIVYDNEWYYVVTVFEKTTEPMTYTQDELDFGFEIYKDPLWARYKNHQIWKLQKNIKRVEGKATHPERVEELKELVERLKEYGKN